MRNFITGITRMWWIPLITGLISIGLGIWCLFSPTTSLPVMAYIFAILFLIAGLANVVFGSINLKVSPDGGWTLALGLLEAVAGIWLLTLPTGELTTTFVIVLGIWLIVAAINSIAQTVAVSRGSAVWSFFSIILLVATIIFAFIFIMSPVATALAGWLYLGISLITFGVFRLCIASRMNSVNKAFR